MATFLFAFVISYLYHGLGITLGYHRLLSHRSFKVPRWFEYLLVSGGYLCFEGSPIYWVTTHRLHHRYSDKPGDPHSPRDGFWHAFIGWMYKPRVVVSDDESRMVSPDMYRDPVYNFLHLNHSNWHALLCLVLCIAFRIGIFILLGPVVLTANLAATGLTFLSPLLVNSFSHMPRLGYQNFNTGEDSSNVWWVALLSLGEGWHNNHHALPQSARHGMKLLEPDLSWEALRVLRTLGFATDLRLPKHSRLVEAGLAKVSATKRAQPCEDAASRQKSGLKK